MTYTDEHLSAYLDGELDSDIADRLEVDLQGDPALLARLESLRMADDLVRQAYGPIADEPIPEAFLSTLDYQEAAPNNIVALRPKRLAAFVSNWQAPLAAGLALAIGLSIGIATQTPSGPTGPATENVIIAGTLPIDSSLSRVLDTAPSAQRVSVSSYETVQTVLSFHAIDGGFCREFTVESGSGATRAVACRSDAAWTVLVAVAEPKGPQSVDAYATASAMTAPMINSLVDQLIDGAPLSAADEAEALATRRAE